jgi:hypothetical protein
MNVFQAWVQEELERAVREEAREYLLRAATAWVAGDGVSACENMHRLKDLGWLDRLSDAVGWDRAHAIRCEVVAVHLRELAAQARLAVPADVVDAWHTVMLASITRKEPLAASDGDGFDHSEAVREGLLWLYKVKYDRDLFDQSGLPESYWCGQE